MDSKNLKYVDGSPGVSGQIQAIQGSPSDQNPSNPTDIGLVNSAQLNQYTPSKMGQKIQNSAMAVQGNSPLNPVTRQAPYLSYLPKEGRSSPNSTPGTPPVLPPMTSQQQVQNQAIAQAQAKSQSGAQIMVQGMPYFHSQLGYNPYPTSMIAQQKLPPVQMSQGSVHTHNQSPTASGANSGTASGSSNQPATAGQGEPFENGKTRMRVSRACDRCRTQKIKCSGTHPCTNCVKHKKDCNYSTTFNHHMQPPESPHNVDVNINDAQSGNHFAPNKRQKVILGSVEPFGLPIISKSRENAYTTHLENRVQYLEGLLADNSRSVFKRPRNNEPDIRESDRILVSPSSKWRFSRRHQNILIVELCRSMYLNLSPDAQKQVKLPRTQYFGWNLSGCNYLSPEELPPPPPISDKIDTTHYINYFFEEINPLYAILHETVFREQVDAYTALLSEEEKNTNKIDSKTHQTRLFSAILYLVYALAIRFTEFSKPKGPSFELLKLEEKYFKYAYKVISVLSFEWESFELIQSWLLITLYLRICYRQTSAYHALGQAVFMAKSMGLEQAVPPLTTSTNYERLKAKRIYWCVYTMDRMLGLQTGRYCGLTDEDRVREFPSFNFKEESGKDNWLTLEAFGMLQLARVANYVHTMSDDNPDVVKYQQLNLELSKARSWLNENGFANDDLYNKKLEVKNTMCKVQVKLQFYDLLMCVHGKLMFNYIGRRVASHGLRIEMVLEACHGIVEIMDKCNKAGTIYTPWYMGLVLLFNVGAYAITMINGGVFPDQCRKILQKSIKLIGVLKNSPVRNDAGKIIFKERFKMAKECLWALKMANRILILKLREDIKALSNIGIDHGSSDVNKQMFNQIGLDTGAAQTNEFSKLLDRQNFRKEDEDDESDEEDQDMSEQDKLNIQNLRKNESVLPALPNDLNTSDISPGISLNQSENLNNADYEGTDNLLGNLQWFDKWLDFDYDF